MVDDHGVVVSEGVDACDHLVDDDTKSPPVYRFSMSLILKNLWCEVLWSSTEGESSIFDKFSKAKVSKFDIAIRSYENILWF